MSFAISSGHSKYVAGAIGIVKEVEEARKIVDRIVDLADDIMPVHKFHDDTSRTQKENINRIVAFHNNCNRRADYSMHLNASTGKQDRDIGVEVLYYSDANRKHAEDLASALSQATGLKSRGAKKRTDLGFLKETNKPAFLIEAYFVNSRADVSKMDEAHEINAFAAAFVQTVAKYLGLSYQTSSTKPHKIKTGTYTSEKAAENARQLMGKYCLASVNWSYVIKDGDYYRVITGTYPSKIAADNAIQKMRDKNILKDASAFAV